ncbi:MAG: M56 family metallopeptidase [Clostridia bacterium]
MRTAILYNFLLEANLMASIAIVLMLLVRKVFRKSLGNRAIYFAWLLVAIRLLCPLTLPNPAINEIRSPFAADEAIRPIAGQIKVRFTDAVRDTYYGVRESDVKSENTPLMKNYFKFYQSTENGMLSIYLMELYGLGIAAVLGWFILDNLRFRRRLKADRIEPISGKLLAQYEALCTERGIKPIPVYFTDPLPSACLVGTFRPYIALPLSAAPEDAIRVLTHEVCHVKGHDHLWAILRLLCCAVHWFNPLVWAAAHMSRTDCELACDDRVIEKLNHEERLAYANVLVLAAAKHDAPSTAVLATGMTMTGRKLKKRVSAIVQGKQRKKALAVCFMVLACILLLGAFATAEYQPIPKIPTLAQDNAIPKRVIQSNEDAIAFAKALWQSEALQCDITGMTWNVISKSEEIYDVQTLMSESGKNMMTMLNADGHVRALYNNNTALDRGMLEAAHLYADHTELQDELARYLLHFTEQLNPGSSNKIEAMSLIEEMKCEEGYFVVFHGEGETVSRYVVQVLPQVRVVQYSENIQIYDSSSNG